MKRVIIRLLILLNINQNLKKMTVDKKNIWTGIVNTILTLISGIASVYGLGVIG
jgi:hypothetical protein